MAPAGNRPRVASPARAALVPSGVAGLLVLLLSLGLPARGGAAPPPNGEGGRLASPTAPGATASLAGPSWFGAPGSSAWPAWPSSSARPASPASPASPARPASLHELHETYAELAIEGATVAGRVQFFKKDLERALGPMLDVDAVALTPGPEADALVLRYLRHRLRVVAGSDTLTATLLRAEEVRLAHHDGWQVTLSWQATAPVGRLAVRNTLLFELHDDQRNVMRFVRFPGETRETVTTEVGAPEAVVTPRPAG